MNMRKAKNEAARKHTDRGLLGLALLCVVAMLMMPAPNAVGGTCGPLGYGSDFSSLPPGASIFGNAQVTAGVLKLTEAYNSQSGTFVTPNFSGSISEFTLEAQIRIGDSTCCTGGRNQLRPADGISLNFAPDIPMGAAWSGGALEEGVGTGLRVTFDTWDNGDPDTAPAIELIYNGVTKAVAGMDGWRDNNNPDAGYIPLDPQNGAPLTLYTDARDQTMVEVTSGDHAGEIYQCHQGDVSRDLATLPGGEMAGPTKYVGLACDINEIPAAPDTNHIALVQRGICTFNVKGVNVYTKGYKGMVVFNHTAGGEDYITMGSCHPDLPAVMVGRSRGLAIAGVANDAGLVIGNPGANVSVKVSWPTVAPYGEFRWVLRPDGTSDVWWKGVKVIDNVQTGFVPTPGRFGFGARTGGGNESHWVDEFVITAEANATPETGTKCYDGIDNDCDSFADAADPDCPACVPMPEVCNNLDDDCNGVIDDGIAPVSIVCGIGACSNNGQRICQNGSLVDACVPLPASIEGPFTSSTCDDDIDNDCDTLRDAADPGCAVSVCDVDRDGDIDKRDTDLILRARGQTVQAGDPRDADGDRLVTVLDGKMCIQRCTRPLCAVQ